MTRKLFDMPLRILAASIIIATSLLAIAGCGNGDTPTTTTNGNGDVSGYAARLDSLEGKTICELSNDEWQAFRILTTIRNQLKELYPTATIVPYTEFPMGLVSMGQQSTADALSARGCDCVILANVG